MDIRRVLVGLIASALCAPMACGGESTTTFTVNGGSGGSGATGGAGGKNGGGKAGADSTGGESAAGDGPGAGTGGVAGSVAGTTGNGGDGGTTDGQNTLSIAVGAKPPGSAATVLVEGPDGFSQLVTTNTSFSGLEPGTYVVTASSARDDGALVDELYAATVVGSPAEIVEGGSASVSVTYATTKQQGSGMMWVSNWMEEKVVGYSPDQLDPGASTYTGAPAVVLTLEDGDGAALTVGPVAFDQQGNLWLATCAGGGASPQRLLKYGPAKLVTGAPAADVVVSLPDSATYDCAAAMAFEADGDLWVGFFDGPFVRYSKAQLAESGAPAPSATHLGYGFFAGLDDMLIDAQGNLWIAAYENNRVSKLTPTDLETSNDNLSPAVVWYGSSIAGPAGLAQAGDGKVWVANYDAPNIVAFGQNEFGVFGNPQATIAINPAGLDPVQIAFDEAGNLWATSYATSVMRFDATAITSTGNKDPGLTLSSAGNVSTAYAVRFNPPAN